jgi:hypothetical protein
MSKLLTEPTPRDGNFLWACFDFHWFTVLSLALPMFFSLGGALVEEPNWLEAGVSAFVLASCGLWFIAKYRWSEKTSVTGYGKTFQGLEQQQ